MTPHVILVPIGGWGGNGSGRKRLERVEVRKCPPNPVVRKEKRC